MIEGLLEDDILLQSIFEESNLTKTQLDSLLLAFQYKIKGYSLDEIVKMRDSGPVSKGSYLRTLGQAQSNFRGSLYTLLLVVYLGILDTSTIADFVALSDRLSSLKDMDIPEDTVNEIRAIIDEIGDRITADKVL
ncbi:MAG TPA: hypothetical protein EYM50_04415 [Nitrososphaerales archaeon]|nr:hypothetical protein [Nitrososphaerales archaeon]